MENEPKRFNAANVWTILKNLLVVLFILQFAPMVFTNFKTALTDSLYPKSAVGYLTVNSFIADSSYYVKKIDEFSKDSDIKALLIKINSPGGYSGSSQAIFSELKRFKKNKPVVAFIENMGASGAYYVAMAANTIVASPISLVGSIGVFLEIPNVKDLLNSWKVHYRYVQSGTYKTVGSMMKDINPQELAYLQSMTDDQYKQFVADVATSRHLNANDHKVWADGKAFTGNQALKLRLIDKLGSFSDALDEVKRVANIKEEIKLIQPKRPSNIARLIGGDDDFGQDQMTLSDQVAGFLSDVCAKFQALQTAQPKLG